MSRYSIREVVEMAVQTERLGQQFYADMARKFESNQGLNQLFILLGEKEVLHERIFAGMLDTLSGVEPQGWEDVQPYFRAIVESQYFLGGGKALPNMDGVRTVLEATDFAINFEKETTLYFTGLRLAVPEADRRLVDDIIKEETEHIVWLSRFKARL